MKKDDIKKNEEINENEEIKEARKLSDEELDQVSAALVNWDMGNARLGNDANTLTLSDWSYLSDR